MKNQLNDVGFADLQKHLECNNLHHYRRQSRLISSVSFKQVVGNL